MAIIALGMAGLFGVGGLQLYFVAWFRRSAVAARIGFAEAATAIPVAKIDAGGKGSIVTGVAVVRGATGKVRPMGERESLLSDSRY